MKKKPPLPWCGIGIEHIDQILKLVLVKNDLPDYIKDEAKVSVIQSSPSLYNDFYSGTYLVVAFPVKFKEPLKSGLDKAIWYLRILETGYISFETGSGVTVRINNALDVYKILVDNFKLNTDEKN